MRFKTNHFQSRRAALKFVMWLKSFTDGPSFKFIPFISISGDKESSALPSISCKEKTQLREVSYCQKRRSLHVLRIRIRNISLYREEHLSCAKGLGESLHHEPAYLDSQTKLHGDVRTRRILLPGSPRI